MHINVHTNTYSVNKLCKVMNSFKTQLIHILVYTHTYNKLNTLLLVYVFSS